jgi:hypothetical protein
MQNKAKMALAALLGLTVAGIASAADSKQVIAANASQSIHKIRPARAAGRGALAIGRAAGHGARAAARAGVVAGRVAKPGRRAAWLARAGARGAGKAARAASRGAVGAAKVVKPRPFRLIKKKVVPIP